MIWRPTFYIHFNRIYNPSKPCKGFKLQLSFHEKSARLPKVSHRQWNCSVVQWPEYRQHFPCNLFYDCVDGTDETPCPYFSSRCGPGQFLAADRCYIYQEEKEEMSWNAASVKCRQATGYLASLNSPQEWVEVLKLLMQFRQYAVAHLGIRTTKETIPQIYGRAFQLMDSSIAYYFFLKSDIYPKPHCFGVFISPLNSVMRSYGCSERKPMDHLCEIGPAAVNSALSAEKKKQPGGALKTSSMFTLHKGSAFNSTHFATCPDGHLTHVFFACDAQSASWTQRGTSCAAPMTPLPPSFSCSDGLLHVPYTLVCDFQSDCKDNSDEKFCRHPPCLLIEQFECQNGQCVSVGKMCNRVKDCVDGTDETYCSADEVQIFRTAVTGPAYVNFTHTGQAILAPLSAELNQSHYQDTPIHTHRCPDQYFGCVSSDLCFPVYTRCNDVYDCPGREDEFGCDDSYKCPGLFRCRGSSMCVAPSELCDSIYHCPQYDDELMCALSCPATCTCHGLAFFCHDPFSSFKPGEYQHLRFLNLLDMSNLHSLDLSDNILTNITDQHLSKMPYLRHLILSGNPLISIFAQNDRKSSSVLLSRLQILDLSRVIMTKILMIDLSIFPNLQTLNLSDCRVDTLQGSGSQTLSALRVLDVRGCPLTHFQADFFSSLSALEELFSDNYKLCCPVILPPDFNLAHCKAPSDEISSCDNLLRSNVYRVFLTLFVILALTGNIFVFIFRVVLSRPKNGFEVFTVMLCVSDFLMGIYLAIIGVADRLYLGSYLWNDVSWRHSIPCSLAGFLSMVSNEVSAFVICLITLDRFLVLRFPFSSVRFNRTSGVVVSGFVWLVGVVLATVPLLPFTAHWQFYAVNGICVPLPISRKGFPGHRYSFSLMIVLNFVLFLLIAVGQLFIYLSVQKHSMPIGSSNSNTKSNSRDLALGRRLILIAVTDFVCWFPIGLLGFLASRGVSISGEVNVAMAIFVLPLNSAINPFLYTVNRMLETRRVKREQRLMNQLLKQAKQQAAVDHAKGPTDDRQDRRM